MFDNVLSNLLGKNADITPPKRRLNMSSDPEFSSPKTSKSLSRLYKVPPTHVAREIKFEALQDEKNEYAGTTFNILQKISEDPTEHASQQVLEKSHLESDRSETGRSISQPNGKSIFQAELIHSSKYQEVHKGPIVRAGKLIRHSIAGPTEIFERYHRRKNYFGKQQQQDADSSFTSTESALSLYRPHRQLSNLTDSSLLTSNMSKKIVEPKHKEFKKEIKVSKEQFFTEIETIKNRERGFYSSMERLSHRMRTSDMLFFTKEKRCLESFEKKQENWKKVFEKTNEKLGRSLTESVAVKADEYREKIEKADTFEIIKTDQERFGTMSWYMTLRKKPGLKETRGAVIINEIPAGFNSAVVDRSLESLEIIRKPKLFNPAMSTRESTRSTFNSPKILDRTGREYYESRFQRSHRSISKIKAEPTDPDALVVNSFFS